MTKQQRNATVTKHSRRRADLAKIHIWANQCGIKGEAYREMLKTHGGKPSAGDMTASERRAVLKHLFSCVCGTEVKYKGRPKNMDDHTSRARQLKKIEALLTVGGKSWAYADGIAQRICRVDKVEWVRTEDLFRVITALIKQGKREGWELRD